MSTIFLYLNGLNHGTISAAERWALQKLADKETEVRHISVDWCSGATFDELLTMVIAEVRQASSTHDRVVIVGASAGGSLAVNVYGRVGSPNVHVVTLCSRLQEPKLGWWDVRTLKRMAHIGTKRASQSFYDSLLYCQNVTIPALSATELRSIISIKQWADEIVPRRTMCVPGVRMVTVPGVGHQYGIAAGIYKLRSLIVGRGLAAW